MSVKNLFLRNNRIRNQTAKGRGKKGCFLTQSYLDESVSEVARLLLERVHPLTQQSVLRSQALKCGGDMKPDPFLCFIHEYVDIQCFKRCSVQNVALKGAVKSIDQ